MLKQITGKAKFPLNDLLKRSQSSIDKDKLLEIKRIVDSIKPKMKMKLQQVDPSIEKYHNPAKIVRNIENRAYRPNLTLQGLGKVSPIDSPVLSVVLEKARSKQLSGAKVDTFRYANGVHKIHETTMSWVTAVQKRIFDGVNEPIQFPDSSKISELDNKDLTILFESLLALLEGRDIYKIIFQTDSPKLAVQYFLGKGFKPSIFVNRDAIRFDDGGFEIEFKSSLDVVPRNQSSLERIDHFVLNMAPDSTSSSDPYLLYLALCDDHFWGDVNDINFSRSIEADGVGMHTEVREPKNSRALIPIIYSSEPELAMVKHFLAPKDDKKYTLSVAINTLLSTVNDDSKYLPDYLTACINQFGGVDIEQFQSVVYKNQVSRGIYDMNSQLGRSSKINTYLQHVASSVRSDLSLPQVTEQISIKTPAAPKKYYEISSQSLVQRALLPLLYDSYAVDTHGMDDQSIQRFNEKFFDLFSSHQDPEKIREKVFSWIDTPNIYFKDNASIRNNMLALAIDSDDIDCFLKKMDALLPIFNLLADISIENDNVNDILTQIFSLNILLCSKYELSDNIYQIVDDIKRTRDAGNQCDFVLNGIESKSGFLEQRFTVPEQMPITQTVGQFWEFLKRCNDDGSISSDSLIEMVICGGFGQQNFKALMEAQQAGIASVDNLDMNEVLAGKNWPRISVEHIIEYGLKNRYTIDWAKQLGATDGEKFLSILEAISNEIFHRGLVSNYNEAAQVRYDLKKNSITSQWLDHFKKTQIVNPLRQSFLGYDKRAVAVAEGTIRKELPDQLVQKFLDLSRVHMSYPGPFGDPIVLDKLAIYFNQQGLETTDQHLMITNGASDGFSRVMKALLADQIGSELITPGPFFSPQQAMIKRANSTAILKISDSVSNSFRPDFDDIKSKITPHTKSLILTSPHNPSGTVLSVNEFSSAIQLCQEYGLFLVVDGTYMDMSDVNCYTQLQLALNQNNFVDIVVIGSNSKIFSPAIRSGWLWTPNQALRETVSHGITIDLAGVSTSSSAAMAVTLDHMDILMKDYEKVIPNRKLWLNCLEEMNIDPPSKIEAGLYMLLPTPSGISGSKFSTYLFETYDMNVVPLKSLSGEPSVDYPFIRVACVDQELTLMAIQRYKQAYEDLNSEPIV